MSTWGPGTGLAHTNYNANAPTPSFALLFKPIPNVTTYASYAQALQGGDTAPSAAANANAVLPPSVSQQYEVGVKAAVGNVNLSLALFRIDKVNAELNRTNNVYMQDGREIHQGIEAMATGRLTPELTLIGGFTLLDAYVANASALPATNGKIRSTCPNRKRVCIWCIWNTPRSSCPTSPPASGRNIWGGARWTSMTTSGSTPHPCSTCCLEVLCYQHMLMLGAAGRAVQMIDTVPPWMQATNPAVAIIPKLSAMTSDVEFGTAA